MDETTILTKAITLSIAVSVWARGYFVNTAGITEDMIRRYVKYRQGEERNEETNQQGFDFGLGT